MGKNQFDKLDKLKDREAKKEVVTQWLRFVHDRQWSRKQKRRLLTKFRSVKDIYSADITQIIDVVGTSFVAKKSNVDKQLIRAELAWLQSENHHLITYFNQRYPALLREINDPPIALYAVGDIDLLARPKVAIVGSRRPSPVGLKVTQDIAATLGELDIAVVSGLALGVDGAAHSGALSRSGPTIAVMGCGIDIIYPARHASLFNDICHQGLVLSEYPLGCKPTRYTFPERNRLVSGLSSGVVIVEAAERSGTLITARMAVEQNRELMAVPGAPVSAQYAGSHRLLKDGAALVCNGEDVLQSLSSELSEYCKNESISKRNSQPDQSSLSKQQQALLALLGYESASVDFLVQKSSLTAAEVSAILLELELLGMVSTTVDGGYVRMT